MTYRVPLQSLVGLPLLYASAYFLPPLGAAGSYLLPSHDVFRLIVLPTAVAVVVGGVLVYFTSAVIQRFFGPKGVAATAILALSVLSLIGLKGVLLAAGYDWEEHVPRGSDLITTLRYVKYLAFFILAVLIFFLRGAIRSVNRILSSLGFALGLLAAVRLFNLWESPTTLPTPLAAARPSATQSAPGTAPIAGMGTRRVVWIIFDETDFGRVYGEEYPGKPDLKNFNLLAHSSVFAANANSPASATLYSIPALLTGIPIGGAGVRFDKFGDLWLENADSTSTAFNQETSIFGELATTGRSASVLGFYHPYCKLFRMLQRCDGAIWPRIGGLDAALWANVPDFLANKFGRVDVWERVTGSSLQVLPQYLARDDALTFVHLNFPHLPATYADNSLGMTASANPLVEYSHNLMLADRVLGEIVAELTEQASRHDIMLVVSTDHWLRNRSYQANIPEVSRPIPLLMWRVGATDGIVISNPLSTVHTAGLILDFLDGKLTTQADIAHWWENRSVYPSFIVPNT